MASRDGQVFFRNAAGRVRVLSLGDGSERFSLGEL